MQKNLDLFQSIPEPVIQDFSLGLIIQEPETVTEALKNVENPGQTIVHYFDKNDALRSGYLLHRIKQGKNKGDVIVKTSEGGKIRTHKIRNIEEL